MSHLPQLREVQVFDGPISDERLLQLRTHQELELLICEQGEINAGLLAERQCKTRLKALSVRLSKLDSKACDAILEFSALELRYIDGSGANDDCVCRIATLPNLKTFSIRNSPVTELSLICCCQSASMRKVKIARGRFSEATPEALATRFPERQIWQEAR